MLVPILAIGSLLTVLVILTNLVTLLDWKFPDPDDELRLVQVRDLLSGQGWFDLHQYRINPANSPVMHWSRIVDLPIAIAIILLTPLVGPGAAENGAVFIIPIIALFIIVALTA